MEERETPDNNNSAENMEDEELTLAGEAEGEEEKAFEQARSSCAGEIEELNNKYLRLYAEFDNYKKRVNKDKEELVRYGNESLLNALLPAIDNLELALKHGACDPKTGVVEGVEITLRELQRTLEKFGVTKIAATGKKFDPAVHHAMVQVERDDLDEKMVAEELRAGYLYNDKVLRPSLVSVSVKPKARAEDKRKHKGSLEEGAKETDSDKSMTNETIEEER